MVLQMMVIAMIMMMVCYGHNTSGTGAVINEFSGEYYPLFRAMFLICFFGALHGLCLFVWRRSGINYRALFGVPHAHNYHSVMRAFFTVMTIVFSSFVLYVLTLTVEFTPNRHIWPMLAILLSLLYLLAPWDWMPTWADRLQRYKLIVAVGQVLLTPAFPTTFLLNFVADVITSMPKVFVDILFTTCIVATGEAFAPYTSRELQLERQFPICSVNTPWYYTARLVLSVLPFWIRFVQASQAEA